MSSPAVTVHLPDNIYEYLSIRAAESKRTLPEELVRVVSLIIPEGQRLPPDLEDELARLPALDDDQLWDAAQGRVASEVDNRLEELADLRRERGRENEEGK